MSMARIAYLTQLFPLFSLTFIVDEIEEMRAQGVDITLLSVRRPTGDLFPPAFRRYHDECGYLLPVRPLQHLLGHLKWLFRRPAAYLSCWWIVLTTRGCSLQQRLKLAAYLCEAVALADTVHPGRFEHLHVHFLFGVALVARFLKRLTGMPYSVTGHGTDFLVERWLLADKVSGADFVRIGTRFNAEFLRSQVRPEGADKLFVLPFGIDARRLAPDAAASVARIDSRANPRVKIINVGRLVWQKGQGMLLDAAALLVARGVPFELHIIGDGELHAPLVAQAARLGLGQVVTFHGALPRAQVLGAMEQADILAFSSVSEGFGIVLLEGMLCGLAIVATDIMGVAEIIRDGETGLIDREKTPDSLADRLEALVRDQALRMRLQHAGHQSARQDFDHRDQVRMLKERMLAKRPDAP
jgi:colanic acid/amylovoran biosynthesis glycosyltransferase